MDTNTIVARKTLQKLGVEIPEDYLFSHNDNDFVEQCLNLALKSGFTKKEFIDTYNNLIEPTAKERLDGLKQERLAMFLANINMNNAYQNVEYFFNHQPFFYDKNGIFWFWNETKYKYEMADEVDLLTAISKRLDKSGHIVMSGLKSKYLESFKQIGRMNHPIVPDKNWIQFKDKIFDIKTKEIFAAEPKYFLCNPIDYEIGSSPSTPTMDKLFREWVGDEYVDTLYEIIAYCCFADYPIHSLFCLSGSGRNGKSRFLALVNKFIGKENICSTELDSLLDSRFESAKLYKKLACLIGETNFGTLSKTSLIKKLTGQDLIGYEFKGKLPFDDYNYAKLIISSNSLPPTTDSSEGFFRRWMIIDFPNEFKEGSDILETIPEIEYNNLANKIIEVLPRLLKNGKFTNQGSIAQRQERYIMASNPLPKFIDEFCVVDYQNGFVKYAEFYHAYLQYLQANKKRIIKMKAFRQILAEEGFDIDRTRRNDDMGQYIIGLNLKPNWKDLLQKVTKVTDFSFPYIEKNLDIKQSNFMHFSHKTTENEVSFINLQKIFQPCSICYLNPDSGNYLDSDHKPICELCLNTRLHDKDK